MVSHSTASVTRITEVLLRQQILKASAQKAEPVKVYSNQILSARKIAETCCMALCKGNCLIHQHDMNMPEQLSCVSCSSTLAEHAERVPSQAEV